MKKCFHSNQHPWAISKKHKFIFQISVFYIWLLVMHSLVFPSLDDIYCTIHRPTQQSLMPCVCFVWCFFCLILFDFDFAKTYVNFIFTMNTTNAFLQNLNNQLGLLKLCNKVNNSKIVFRAIARDVGIHNLKKKNEKKIDKK